MPVFKTNDFSTPVSFKLDPPPWIFQVKDPMLTGPELVQNLGGVQLKKKNTKQVS